ncbi:leucine zipper domain-containing protein [Pseudomonas sp. A-1]|uniref:leucine zipper domain-containing protein n=1 Tax=Pseudomonas sp. A-1 TaxID=1821274 RepID=UPI0035563219
MVQRILNGLRAKEAAQAAGISLRTAYKWLRCFREEEEAGLIARHARTHASTPRQTS